MESEQTRLLREIHEAVMKTRAFLESHEEQLPLIEVGLRKLAEETHRLGVHIERDLDHCQQCMNDQQSEDEAEFKDYISAVHDYIIHPEEED